MSVDFAEWRAFQENGRIDVGHMEQLPSVNQRSLSKHIEDDDESGKEHGSHNRPDTKPRDDRAPGTLTVISPTCSRDCTREYQDCVKNQGAGGASNKQRDQ